MMSVRCFRSVASLTTALSLRSWISMRLGTPRRLSNSWATRARAACSCLPSLPWAALKPRMLGRRRGSLSAAAAPYSRSSLPRSARAARISLSKARCSGLAMVRVGSSGSLVIDQRIEQELFSHVLEEVLLSPAIEHTVGDLDVAQIPSTGDHLGLIYRVE